MAAGPERTTSEAVRRPSQALPLPRPQSVLLLFLAGTVMAVSPIGREIDLAFHLEPVRSSDGLMFTVLADGFDRLASQSVAGLALGLLAMWLSWRRRSIGPVLIVVLAQTMFLATGLVKVLLAKRATPLGAPQWWERGLLEHGEFSMAYPSGHATESVLLFGTMVLLLRLYGPAWSQRRWRQVIALWALAMTNTVLVSWLLGRHWISDLASGLVFGLFCLGVVVRLYERLPFRTIDPWIGSKLAAGAERHGLTRWRRAPRSPQTAMPRPPRP